MDSKAADTTRTIAIPDDGVEALFGSYDENLRFIESVAGVRVSTQGHDLQVTGDAAAVARVELLVGASARAPEGRLPPLERRREDRRGTAAAGPVGRPARLLPEDDAAAGRRAAGGLGEERQPEAVHRGHRPVRHGLRHRPGGHGQDLPGHGAGGVLPAGEARRRGSSWRARRSRPARSSASCPAISRRRSTRTSGRSTTRSTT